MSDPGNKAESFHYVSTLDFFFCSCINIKLKGYIYHKPFSTKKETNDPVC